MKNEHHIRNLHVVFTMNIYLNVKNSLFFWTSRSVSKYYKIIYTLGKTNNVSKWELKYPSKLCNDEKLKNFDNYFEIEEVDKIIEFVLKLSKNYTLFDGVDRDSIDKFDIESLIKLFDLKEFAKINSHRKSYSIDQIEIDLDETDFGYKVGELEIILDDKSTSDEIENATNQISKMVKKLGKLFLTFLSKIYFFLNKIFNRY